MAESNPSQDGKLRPGARDPTSVTLLGKLRQKQEGAWERVDALYGPLIHIWCRRWSVAPDHCADIRQKVFIVVFEKFDGFRRERPGDTFRGWLHEITRWIVLDHFRKIKNQPQALGGTDAGRQFQDVPDPLVDDENDTDADVAELHRRALEFIQSDLDDRDREIIRLTTSERFPAAEVAKQLGMKVGTVRVRKCRILKRLKEELLDEGCDVPVEKRC